MSTSDDWPPQDEHLRAALRHAPDRDLQPPAALSARILDQARRQVAPWPARRLAWIMKPAGSAAFASVLLAGFIGLMWRGDVPPPAAEKGAIAESAAVKPRESATSPAETSRADSRETRAARAASAERSAAAAPAAAVEQPVPATPVPPISAAPPAQALAKAQRQEAAGNSVRADDAPARVAEPAAQALKDDAGARASAARIVPTDPLAAPIAQLRDAGTAAPTLESWAQLQAAAKGRWQLLSDVAPPRGTEVRTPQGVLLGRLAIDEPHVRWQAAADASVWQVEVPAALAERLRAALIP